MPEEGTIQDSRNNPTNEAGLTWGYLKVANPRPGPEFDDYKLYFSELRNLRKGDGILFERITVTIEDERGRTREIYLAEVTRKVP